MQWYQDNIFVIQKNISINHSMRIFNYQRRIQNIYNLLNHPSNVVQFQAFEEGMQVNGGTIMAIVDGMGGFKDLALEFLAESGLPNIVPDEKNWYSQQKWLNAFQMVSTRIGESMLFLIGKKIPKNAVFPSGISKNIEEALKSINIAYHINHKNKNGEILYDVDRDPPCWTVLGIIIIRKLKN